MQAKEQLYLIKTHHTIRLSDVNTVIPDCGEETHDWAIFRGVQMNSDATVPSQNTWAEHWVTNIRHLQRHIINQIMSRIFNEAHYNKPTALKIMLSAGLSQKIPPPLYL